MWLSLYGISKNKLKKHKFVFCVFTSYFWHKLTVLKVFVEYLFLNDYYSSIQEEQLNDQILDSLRSGYNQRIFSESWAIEKIYNYTKNRYDLDSEFTKTSIYDPKKTYNAWDRVYLDYPVWVSKSYVLKDCITKDGLCYECTTANTDTTFNPVKWKLLGNLYDIFHVPYPNPLFSLDFKKSKFIITEGYYKVGDIVFWENKRYECKQESKVIDYQSKQQLGQTSDIPHPNVFPNDPISGSTQWKDLGAYSVSGNIGYDGTKFVFGDNRNPVFVQFVVDLSLYILHKRISPRNIPEHRISSFEMSMSSIHSIGRGEEMINIQEIQPNQGRNTRHGSDIKKQNSYT